MIAQGSHLTQQPTPNNPKTQPKRKKTLLDSGYRSGPTNEPRSPPGRERTTTFLVRETHAETLTNLDEEDV